MPRTCTVCKSPCREEVDRALLAGTPHQDIARHTSLSRWAIRRHERHLPALLARSNKAAEVARADDLVSQLQKLTQDARRIQEKAERSHNFAAALGAIRELVRIVELLAKLRGELISERRTTNVLNLNLDAETAERIARTYLLRRRTAPQPSELP